MSPPALRLVRTPLERVKSLLVPHAQYEAGLERLLELMRGGAPDAVFPSADEPAGRVDFTGDADSLEEDGSEESGPPEKSCLLMIGQSGTGKTRLLETLQMRPEFKSVVGGLDGDVRPIVSIRVPDPPTPKGVIQEFCSELSVPQPKGWTLRELAWFLRTTLRDLGVRLLQMDEAHVFVDELTARQVKINARFLKFLVVHSGVPIALAGEEPLEGLLAYPALRRRMYPPVRLRPYGWSAASEATEFRLLISGLEAEVGMPNQIDASLAGIEPAARLYYASRGIVGLLAQQFIEAEVVARENRATALTLDHFASAWERWRKSDPVNSADPFNFHANDEYDLDNPYSCAVEHFRTLWTKRLADAAVQADTSGSTLRGRRPSTPKLKGFMS